MKRIPKGSEGLSAPIRLEEVITAWYLLGSHFVPVGVHGGHDVDARVLDEARDPLVAPPVLLAQELRELQQKLTAQHLISMHVPNILELWLHWREQESDAISQGWNRGEKQMPTTGSPRQAQGTPGKWHKMTLSLGKCKPQRGRVAQFSYRLHSILPQHPGSSSDSPPGCFGTLEHTGGAFAGGLVLGW